MALQHCSDSRDYEAALPLLQGVLEVYRRTLGDLHEHTLVGIYNLADLCAPDRPAFLVPIRVLVVHPLFCAGRIET